LELYEDGGPCFRETIRNVKVRGASEMPQIKMLPKGLDASFRKCYQS
jgi:hypothetical protein